MWVRWDGEGGERPWYAGVKVCVSKAGGMLVNYDDGQVIVEQTKGDNKVEWKDLTNRVFDEKITAQPPAEYWTPPGTGNSVSALDFAHTDHQAWPIAPRTPAEQRDEPPTSEFT